MKRHIPMLLFAASMLALPSSAKVKMGSPFGDGMVLQQQTKVKIWGWTAKGRAVKLVPTWNNMPTACKADANGRWEAWLPTPKGSFKTYSLSVSDGEATTIRNILVGEVWFASGQSNMEMPMNGFTSCPVTNSNQIVAEAGKYAGRFRFVTVPRIASRTPRDTVPATWKDCSPKNARWFSATAYFFGTNLVETLNVPVGIINCSWGGSRVESWLPEDILKGYPDIDLSDEGIRKEVEYKRPLLMYNGMLHPLEGYTVKGFIWYQGESNVGHADTYADRFGTMIQRWRTEWGQGDLPFYYVEIAPYNYGGHDGGALLREAQNKVQGTVPHTGMACTNDLVFPYEVNQIHPCSKAAVGHRLSYLALAETYGMEGVEARSPQFEKMEVRQGKAYVTFRNAGNGFNRMTDIEGFELCGADGVYHAAKAEARGKTVVVSCTDVAEPVNVKYGFHDFAPGNLANTAGLPVVPFRSEAH
jgi:sialate O-acetylesterase